MSRNTPKEERNATYKMLSIAQKMEIIHEGNSSGATKRGVGSVL